MDAKFVDFRSLKAIAGGLYLYDTSSHSGRGAVAVCVFSIENAPNPNPNSNRNPIFACEFLDVG